MIIFLFFVLFALLLFLVFKKNFSSFDPGVFFWIGCLLSPLILGLMLYWLFFLFPGKDHLFYLIVLFLIIALLFLKNMSLIKNYWKEFFANKKFWVLFRLKMKFWDWFLLFVVILITGFVSLIILKWPPTWNDQILYIQHSLYLHQSLISRQCRSNHTDRAVQSVRRLEPLRFRHIPL